MTTSQHLDNPAPPRRWARLFRRTALVPGVDDARALAVANLRILRLEMDKATLLSRVDRLAGQCAPPCWHAARLEAAEVEILRLQTEHAGVYTRMIDVLDKTRAANADGPARGEGGGRP